MLPGTGCGFQLWALSVQGFGGHGYYDPCLFHGWVSGLVLCSVAVSWVCMFWALVALCPATCYG